MLMPDKRVKQWLLAAGTACLLLGSLWVYAAFGGVVVRSDSAIERSTGGFHRIVVRRVPFSADSVGDGAVFEATLLDTRNNKISSQIFRWDSWSPKHVEVQWSGLYEFSIKFGPGTIAAFRCRFVPGQSTQWNY